LLEFPGSKATGLSPIVAWLDYVFPIESLIYGFRSFRINHAIHQDADAPLRALTSSGKMLMKSERRVMSKISR
jgi:hypothetical protein